MRRMRQIALWALAVLVGLPVVLIGLVLIGVNTTLGQHTIEEKLPGLTGGMVQVRGLSGVLPWHLAVEHASVQDQKGTWLELDRADLRVSWAALLHETVKIEQLRADRLAVLRKPLPSPAAPTTEKKSSTSLPSLGVQLDQLSVARIELGQDVMGQALALSVSGHASLYSIAPLMKGVALKTLPNFAIQLDVRRLDQPAHIALNAQEAAQKIDASLHIDEQENGFASTLGHMPTLDPLSVDLSVKGPFQQVQTTLALAAGSAQDGQIKGEVNGRVDLYHLIGDLGVHLTSSAMTLRPDMGWEAVDLTTKLHGLLTSPHGEGALNIQGLMVSGVGAETIQLRFNGDGGEQNSLPQQIGLEGHVAGLRIPGKDPTILAGSPLVLKASLRPLAEKRPFDITLDHDVFRLSLTGGLSPAPAGHLTVAVPDFAKLSGVMGTKLQGHTQLAADFALPVTQTDPLTARLSGDLAFTGGQAQAVNLIGPHGRLAVYAQRFPNGAIQLDDMMLEGRALHINGKGTLDAQKSLHAGMTVQLPDLQQAQPMLRGKTTLGLNLQGALNDLTAQLHMQSLFGLKRAQTVIPTAPLSLDVQVDHLPTRPEGQMALTGTLDRSPVAVQTKFLRDQDGNMGLTINRLEWKTLHGEGQLRLPAGQKIPKGDLDVECRRLDVFRTLIGQPISGRLALNMHTRQNGEAESSTQHHAARPEQDTMQLGLEGQLAMAAYAVQRLSLQGRVAQLPDDPVADLTLAINGIKAQKITGNLQAQVKGPQNALALGLKGRFEHVLGSPAQFDLAALENVPAQRLKLSMLSAEAKGEHLQLMAPADIQYGPTMGVDRLRLKLAAPHGTPAMLDMAGRIKPDLSVSLKLDHVTPSLAEPFVPAAKADGSISASGNVHGTLTAPVGVVEMRGDGLHMRTEPGASFPATSFQIRTTLQGKTAQIQSHIEAGHGLLLALQGTAPLQSSGSFSLATKGRMDLALANAILGASGMGVGGQLSLDMGVNGSVQQPHLSGQIQLRHGSFDHFAQGVHLTDITSDIVASGDHLSVQQLLIHAGEGTMTLTGQVGVLHPGLPIDLYFAMDKAQPLRNDMIEETINSQLHIFGQAKTRLDVDGWVKIPQASITIPDSMPASVPQLDVVNPQVEAERNASPPLLIGLNIDVSSPGQLFVRGHGLFAEMQAKLHVGGTSAAPVIAGGVDLRRGSFNLAGINLNFTQGRIGFDGAGVNHKMDPTVDFRADRNSNGVLASLFVTGHASSPKISFGSSPQLPQDEILAILLFGVNRASLSATQLAELAAAVAQIGGGSAFDPLGTARNALGLDQLTVGGGSSVGNGGTNVEAGKYVMKGVYVGAREGLSGKGTQAQVKIDLTKHLKLNTTVGTGGQVTGFTTPENDPGSSVGLSYGSDY